MLPLIWSTAHVMNMPLYYSMNACSAARYICPHQNPGISFFTLVTTPTTPQKCSSTVFLSSRDLSDDGQHEMAVHLNCSGARTPLGEG